MASLMRFFFYDSRSFAESSKQNIGDWDFHAFEVCLFIFLFDIRKNELRKKQKIQAFIPQNPF